MTDEAKRREDDEQLKKLEDEGKQKMGKGEERGRGRFHLNEIRR